MVKLGNHITHFKTSSNNFPYLAPLTQLPFGGSFTDEDETIEGGGWPWESPSRGGAGEPRFKYSLTSLSTPRAHCIGFARRRMGRGGRYVLDRAYTDHDDLWRSLDLDGKPSKISRLDMEEENGFSDENFDLEGWPHYRPVTPPHCREDWDPDPYKFVLTADPTGLGLPTQPIRPLGTTLGSTPQAGFIRSNSLFPSHAQQGRALGLRTVSVDSLSAQNAATALVTSDMIDIFRTLK